MYIFQSIVQDNNPPVELLVAELAPRQTLLDLFENIYKNVKASVRIRVDAIIIRPPVKWQLASIDLENIISKKITSKIESNQFLLDAFSSLDNVFYRVPDKPIHLLFSHNYEIHLSKNINLRALYSPIDTSLLSSTCALDNIRNSEIDLMIEKGRAKFPPAPGVVYRAPSGRAMKSFIRVGNIQQSRSILDALFFWLLPHLQNCVGLVTDTWSISSISLNISRRLCTYRDDPIDPCPVEMLSRYHDGSPALATEATEIIERLLSANVASPAHDTGNTRYIGENCSSGEVIFLISATHTGSLVTRLQELMHDRGISPTSVRFVALFKIGDTQVKSIATLRDLSTKSETNDFAPIDEHGTQAKIEGVTIDDQVYFPIKYKNFPIVVREQNTKMMCEFLFTYKETELIRVHRTDSDGRLPRHHGIWIDTNNLIEQKQFKIKLKKYLDHLTPIPDLIVTPLHKAACRLGKLAYELLKPTNTKIQHILHPNLSVAMQFNSIDRKVADIVDNTSNNSAILILDDAFITGSRLSSYQTNLRKRSFSGRLHYLVAVARPSSISDWKLRKKMLSYRHPTARSIDNECHTVNSIETIVLPNWSENDCPWCNERKIYRSRMSVTTSSSILSERLATLTDTMSMGLISNLFLEISGRSKMKLTRESLFALPDHSQASVFSSIASALQHLRTEAQPSLGPRKYPISTVLDDSEYLEHTYTDPILRASFLRAAQIQELVYPDTELEAARAERARRLLLSSVHSDTEIAAEIVIAFISKKLPSLDLGSNELRHKLCEFGLDKLLKALILEN